MATEAPCIAPIRPFEPIGRAFVFCIEEDDVNAFVGLLELELTSNLEQDGRSAGAIIGSQHGCLLFDGVGLLIAPRAAVPMSAEQDAARLDIWSISGNDIGDGLVFAFKVG